MSYEIYDKAENCCGCGACRNACPKNAISMKPDDEGFLYPVVDTEKCVSCGLCRKVCAFQSGTSIEARLPEPVVYAAKAKSDDIRMQSGSGGMFTVLSDEMLARGGVVYGVAFDGGLKATHIRAQTVEERDRCRGSKYSQSDMNTVCAQIKEDLREGRSVLFTGTPCQTAGVNQYLLKEDTKNLLLVDIICHGTPSPVLFQEYLKWVQDKRGKKVVGYQHRPKDLGWGHNEKIIFEDGTEEINTALSETWKRIFYGNNCLRPSCHNCKYTNTQRPADITIADFWGIEKFSPEFTDSKGVSLVIINTEKGKAFFEKAAAALDLKEQTMQQAVEKNPNLHHPSAMPAGRTEFWNDYKNGSMDLLTKKYGGYNVKSQAKRVIRRMLEKTGLWTLLGRLRSN